MGVSRLMNLVPAEDRGQESASTSLKSTAVFRDKSGKARLIFREDTGSLELLPELAEVRERAAPSQDAIRQANKLLRQYELWLLNADILHAEHLTTTPH